MSSACARTTDVLTAVTDHQLDDPTPCERLSLRELVAHVGGLGIAFAAAARKDLGELTSSSPGAGGYELAADWRTQYPGCLAGLAKAWQDPGAWEGMTRVGGVDLPGDVCGMVGLTEVVIHGWDVAVATGQTLEVEDDVAQALLAHMSAFTAGGPVDGLFGPAVDVADDAPVLDRALALSGRDPGWRP